MRTEENIREFILENFFLGADHWLDYDTSIIRNGVMDSTEMLQLVEFIGDEFSIVVEDEDIVPENLDTIRRIATFIRKKRAGVPVGLTI